jgi:hypothetical protein
MTNKDYANLANMYHLIRENDETERRIPFETTEGSFSPRKVAVPDTQEEKECLQNIMSALDLPVDWEADELLDLLRSNGFAWGGVNRFRRKKREEENKG